MSDEENNDSKVNALNDVDDNQDNELYAPPKKRRRTTKQYRKKRQSKAKSSVNHNESKELEQETLNSINQNNSNNKTNKNNNDNTDDTDNKENAKQSINNNKNKNKNKNKEETKIPKLKTIQKNAFYYSIGPTFNFKGSTKMEFKVLFASKQLCIRLSDVSNEEYSDNLRGIMFGCGGFNPLFGYMNTDMLMQASKYMDKVKSNEIIQRILIKFDDIKYLNISCQDTNNNNNNNNNKNNDNNDDGKDKDNDNSTSSSNNNNKSKTKSKSKKKNKPKGGHIVVKIETSKIPQIKYQKSSGKRSGYTNISPNDATDLTNGNANKYSFHKIILNQKNEKVLNAMIDLIKKHPKLNEILDKSENYQFNENALLSACNEETKITQKSKRKGSK